MDTNEFTRKLEKLARIYANERKDAISSRLTLRVRDKEISELREKLDYQIAVNMSLRGAAAREEQSSSDEEPTMVKIPICSVCMCAEVNASTLCGHLFCVECLSNENLKNTCPTCRNSTKGWHRIFLN